jgi:dihydroxy-acid dehydratase
VVTIDVDAGRLDVDVAADELERRLAERSVPLPRFETGVFARYAASVGSASDGAVLTPP